MTTGALTSLSAQKYHKMLPEIIKGLTTHMEFCHNFVCFHTKYVKTPSLPEQVVFYKCFFVKRMTISIRKIS
jgi:hypothetical protein